ncbi:hypothetical protein D9615_004264 [Tricholomella constricta]|uniref:C2H2-type domain-containing protein n=1 Tax=Tricholomella constricta TaxID=117010 RepID=A0A8H5HFJ7_9AGAR|nr:hypothetical protein D9615_004264 [Tricholomella constricta]
MGVLQLLPILIPLNLPFLPERSISPPSPLSVMTVNLNFLFEDWINFDACAPEPNQPSNRQGHDGEPRFLNSISPPNSILGVVFSGDEINEGFPRSTFSKEMWNSPGMFQDISLSSSPSPSSCSSSSETPLSVQLTRLSLVDDLFSPDQGVLIAQALCPSQCQSAFTNAAANSPESSVTAVARSSKKLGRSRLQRHNKENCPSHPKSRWVATCTVKSCRRDFSRPADLDRHLKTVHNKKTKVEILQDKSNKRLYCLACEKILARNDSRKRHERICDEYALQYSHSKSKR